LPIRFGAAMLSLSVLVMVHAATGGYARAGAVTGVLAAASTVGGPLAARVTDRYSPRRVLPPLVTGHAVAVATLAGAVTAGLPDPLWYAAATVAGLCTPAAGALTRARWSALAPNPDVLTTGLAIESLTDDLTFVIGPGAATVLAAAVQPVLGPLLTALLVLVGGVAMAAQRQPGAIRRPPSGTPVAARALGALATPAVRVVAVAFVATGMVFSGVQVGLAAATAGYGHAAAAGPIYGCFGIASMCAGFGYGAVGWRSTPVRRVVVGFVALAAGCAVLPFASGLGALAVAVAVPGLAVAPTVIAGNTVVERGTPAGRLAEAFAWLGGACSLGVAVGSALAGRIVDRYGPHAGFLLPVAACVAAAAFVAWSGARRGRVSAR